MDIRSPKELKSFAAQRLEGKPAARQIILLYAGISLGLALLVTVVNYLLALEIDKTGGLSNMGTRAILDTLRQVLPMVQSVLVLCLDLGYCAAMLRIARGQFVSHRTLKLGFDRFWPLLRLSIIRGCILMGAAVASIYLGTMVYMLTPFSNSVMALLEPLMAGATTLDPNILLEGEVYGQVLTAMAPCFVICGLVALVIVVPMWYQYRLASYVLIDKPAYGALMCLRESKLLMRKNRLNLFKLDLSLWYYPVLLALATVVGYGDMLLPLLGIALPENNVVVFFGFYILYLLCQGGIYYLMRNKVEVTYGLAYDSLLPKQATENSVVLGNIFHM